MNPAPTEDARDLEAWSNILQAEPLSLTQRMALSNIIAMALKRSLEAAALNERLEGRPSCPVLTLVVNGGQP